MFETIGEQKEQQQEIVLINGVTQGTQKDFLENTLRDIIDMKKL